jgi:glucose/arabinose dehydrogenase
VGSFAFHPDYLDNGLIYITYTEKPTGKPADFFYADSINVALQWVVSESKMKEIWAYGFRNPHRLAWWDSPRGMILLEAEIGENVVEEINLIEKGQDYGWNVREGNYAVSYKNLATPNPVPDGEAGLYAAPFAQYDHADGNAISGGYVYEGILKALRDNSIFGDIIRGGCGTWTRATA